MKKKPEYITAIDLGSSKTSCLICETNEESVLEIIGFGHVKTKGLRKGMIVNLEEAVRSVKAAVEEAEMMSEISVGSAYVGVAGNNINSIKSTGAVEVRGKHNEIDARDIQEVIQVSQQVSIPEGREIIHLLPLEFVIDRQEGFTDPLGMTGSLLEVRVHIVTGAVSSIKNVIRCINKAGIEVKDIVSNQLASAQATATEDEKMLGIAVVDIGAGITDLSVFIEGNLEYTSVLPVGGDHFTNDIAVGLRTSIKEAEKVKIRYGNLAYDEIENDEIVKLSGAQGDDEEKFISTAMLNEILIPRAEEIITIIQEELCSYNYDREINAGLVLTGGGSRLRGLAELADKMMNLPVRMGKPINITGFSEVIDNPVFASVVGILQYGHYNISTRHHTVFVNRSTFSRVVEGTKFMFGKLFSESNYG